MCVTFLQIQKFIHKFSTVYNKRKKATVDYSTVVLRAWQRPTLPGPFGPSTIGAGGLNGRVRDGYAWNPSAIATKHASVKQTLPREISFITRSENEFLSVLQA